MLDMVQIDDEVQLRREQGKARAYKDMLRAVKADAKTAP